MVGDELRPGGAFTVLLFHAVMVFSVLHSCTGETEVFGSSQPIVALVGTDVVLPCSLQPPVDASDKTIEWTRPDLDPKFILVWRDAVELEFKKNPAFRDRTSLFINELRQGNVSLKLSSVKLSDRGMYRCFPPELNKDATVELVVGAASSPVIQMSNNSTNGDGDGVVVLRCESRGWYPEPEVLWLDSEGNPLSAGPPETVRGPGDLYNVSSRLTVDKRHSNNFTCRVQQKNINQTRETHIHVPDPSTPGSSSPIAAIIGVIVALVVIVAVSVFVWKWRQRRLKNKKQPNDEETLTEKRKKKDPSTQSLMENGRDGETVEDEDTEKHPGLHPQTQDETHQIQTKQEEKKEGEGITERNCLDDRKEETETEHGRNTDNKMKEEPEMENNHQTEEGEKTTQRRGDEMERQGLMDEGKDGEELMDKEKEKLKRKLQAKERDEKKWEERLSRIKSQIEIKEKQINELFQQLDEVEREMESEKREEDEMEKETLRGEDETEKALETKKDLEKKKSELQKDLERMKREKERMKKEETVMIERIKKDTNEKEEIIIKLEEMEKQRNEGENQNDSDDDL